jgi:tetratricopeptide (TPR) repeat protein
MVKRIISIIVVLLIAGCVNERQARIKTAKKLLARRDFGSAIAQLVSYKESNDGEIQYLLGASFLGDSKLGDATFHFYRAIKAKPQLVESVAVRYTQRALELNRVGDYDFAARCFEKAIALKPDLGDNLFVLGDIYFNRGEYALAAETYTNGLASAKDSLSRAKAYEGLVKSYIQLANWAKAKDAAEKGIIERHYGLSLLLGEVSYNYARAFFQSGNLDSAQVMVEKTIEIGRPSYLVDDAYYLLGEIFFSKGDFASAQTAYESVLRFDPYLRGGLVRRAEERLKMIKGILGQ